jgi:hypothetical protein
MLLHNPPGSDAEDQVVRLSRGGRLVRLVATTVLLAVLLGGTLWGDDADFPFGPFRMYSTRADPNTPVVSTRVVGITDAGEEVRLSGGQVGLRRAEFEGQLDRVEKNPELLGLLADSYAESHPSGPEFTSVQVIQRHFELAGGAQTGDYTDRVVVDYELEDGE